MSDSDFSTLLQRIGTYRTTRVMNALRVAPDDITDIQRAAIWLRHGKPLSFVQLPDDAIQDAVVASNRIDILESMIKSRCYFGFFNKYNWTSHHLMQAVIYDNVDVLRVFYEHRLCMQQWPQLCSVAAYYGQMGCLIYAYEHGSDIDKACIVAASKGHIDCLIYAHQHGGILDTKITSAAALDGHLDCLIYAHSHGADITENAGNYAAIYGHIDCLRYIKDVNGSLSSMSCIYAVFGHCECCLLRRRHAKCNYNYENQLACLIYTHAHGGTINDFVGLIAAQTGQLDCLTYAHQHGANLDENAVIAAALNGHLDCLQYLHKSGCALTAQAFAEAAENNQLDCVIYLHENGCEIRTYVQHPGNIDCVKYIQKYILSQ